MDSAAAPPPCRESAPTARSAGDTLPAIRTTLKLRLSLLITALLALVTLAGGAYIVRKARNDTREEVVSTLNLTSHFIDAEIAIMHDRWLTHGYTAPMFHLRELLDVRHLSVKFVDGRGHPIDTNEDRGREGPSAPQWFTWLVRITSQPLPSQTRTHTFNNTIIGQIIIAADPSYEVDEIWETSSGLLKLLLLFFALVNGLVWWAVSRGLRPIDRILAALGEIRRGNLEARLPHFGLPELSRISVGFNHMAETLEESVAENQRLTRRLMQMQEDERARLARDLHDEIGQCVTAIHADAVAIRNRGGPEVRASAEAIVTVTGRIKAMVRSMLQRLRPPVLEGLGLGAALRELTGAFRQRNPQVSCILRTRLDLANLDNEVGIAIYRVIQECLTNIAAHAKAHNVTIEVAQTAGLLLVTVVDDGIGFFVVSTSHGFGLTGIRERVDVFGGTCEVDSNPGHGTCVSVRLPLQRATEEIA
jgi:two-component system sensor histidine kinase UhpB